MNRFLIFAAILPLIIVVTSCNKDAQNPIRIMPYEVNWEIGAGLNSFETHFFEFYNVKTNTDQHFGQDLDVEEIDRIQGRQANLVLLDPNLSFDDVRTVEVYLVSASDPDLEYEVFYTLKLENPNQRRQNIQLIPSLTNIKPVYFEQKMDVIVRLTFWRTSSRNLPVRLEWEMEAFQDS